MTKNEFRKQYPGVIWDHGQRTWHMMALMICYAYNLRERPLFIIRVLIISLALAGCSTPPVPVKKQPVYTTRTTLVDGKFFVMIDTFKTNGQSK